MLPWTSSVLPLPAARAAATSEYAPRARRDSTLATLASPRRFMRMGRRRIWTLGRMLAGNSRIESAALGIRAHCHAAAVATTMAAHRPSCRAPVWQGRQVPGSDRPGRYASGFPRGHDHACRPEHGRGRRPRGRSGAGAGCLRSRSSVGTWSASSCCGGTARLTTSRCPFWRSARSSSRPPKCARRTWVRRADDRDGEPDLGPAPPAH